MDSCRSQPLLLPPTTTHRATHRHHCHQHWAFQLAWNSHLFKIWGIGAPSVCGHCMINIHMNEAPSKKVAINFQTEMLRAEVSHFNFILYQIIYGVCSRCNLSNWKHVVNCLLKWRNQLGCWLIISGPSLLCVCYMTLFGTFFVLIRYKI